jgi:hypothetical protein
MLDSSIEERVVQVGLCLDRLRPYPLLASVVDELVDNCLLGREGAVPSNILVSILVIVDRRWEFLKKMNAPLCLVERPNFPCNRAIIMNNLEVLFIDQDLHDLQKSIDILQAIESKVLDIVLLNDHTILFVDNLETSFIDLVLQAFDVSAPRRHVDSCTTGRHSGCIPQQSVEELCYR